MFAKYNTSKTSLKRQINEVQVRYHIKHSTGNNEKKILSSYMKVNNIQRKIKNTIDTSINTSKIT